MGAKISKCCRCKSKQKENENGVEVIVPNIQVYEETKNDEVSELGEPNLDFSFQLERELDFHFNSIRSSTPKENNQLVLPQARVEPCDPISEDSGSFYDAEEYVQETTKKDLMKTLANSKSVTAEPVSDLEESRSISYKEIDQKPEVETKDLVRNFNDQLKTTLPLQQSTDKNVAEQIGTKNHNALDWELTDEERDFNNTRLVFECKYDIDLSELETTGEKQTVPSLSNGSIISTESLTAFSEHTLLDQNATYRKSSSGSCDSEDVRILVISSRKDVNEKESLVLEEQVLHKDETIRIDDISDDDLQKKTRASADTEYFSDRNQDDIVLNHESDDDLKPNNATITELKAIIESINILESEMESVDKQDTYQTLIKIMMQVNQVKNEEFDEEILHLQNKALNQINRCLRILK